MHKTSYKINIFKQINIYPTDSRWVVLEYKISFPRLLLNLVYRNNDKLLSLKELTTKKLK
jgi:hypothetical protein